MFSFPSKHKLEVESGTEVELRIPAARAYLTTPEERRSWFAEKFARK
jgi:hypothetical protein